MISIPFSGSKKFSYKNVRPIVEAGGYCAVYEPFGGSCVLSANLYNDGLVKRAVINDYDGLFDLYPEYLDYKDWIVDECLKFGIKRRTHKINPGTGRDGYYYINDNGEYVWNKCKLSSEEKKFLQSLIATIPQKYWKLLANGNNFTYSAVSSHKTINLSDFTYFSNYLKTDKQRAYLNVIEKLERTRLDYREFLKRYKPEFNKKSLLIVDPPYCDSYQNQYKTQFTEAQTVELLKVLKGLGVDFIFFNHDEEHVKSWLAKVDINPKSIELTGNTSVTTNHKRKDVMVFVKSSDSI